MIKQILSFTSLVFFLSTSSGFSATGTPALTSPAASSSYQTMSVIYTLPQAPLANSVTLTFSNESTTRVLTMADQMSVNFTLDPTLNPADHESVFSSTYEEIPLGTSDVTFSYQDELGNSANSVTNQSITLEAPAPETRASGGEGSGCPLVARPLSGSAVPLLLLVATALVMALFRMGKTAV